MWSKTFKISISILGLLLILLVLLTAVIGASEVVLKVFGYITLFFIVLTLTSFIMKKIRKE